MINRRLLIIMLAVVLVIAPLAVTAYYVTRNDESHTITGSFVLTNPDSINRLGRYCTGQRDYRDLQQGTAIRLWDAHGNVLATGTTMTGRQGDADCTFSFTLENVPDVDQYHLQFTERPVFVFERSQLEQSDWTVRVDIGD